MSAAGPSQPPFTGDDFLAWERAQVERHEFVDGEVFGMVGASLTHAEITGNLVAALRGPLLPRGCKVYHSDVKVRVETSYFYPDVVVRCGPRDRTTDTIAEPVLLAEVLSPSTQRYDQAGKWDFYQRLPSLQSYLMLRQDRVGVHWYRRSGAVWTFSSHANLDDVLELTEPACSLRVADLYAGIEGIE